MSVRRRLFTCSSGTANTVPCLCATRPTLREPGWSVWTNDHPVLPALRNLRMRTVSPTSASVIASYVHPPTSHGAPRWYILGRTRQIIVPGSTASRRRMEHGLGTSASVGASQLRCLEQKLRVATRSRASPGSRYCLPVCTGI
ncbi:hypothetical protein PYCCODRAFT_780957 [Trametes coccinea BRFM310]|uniref:Uncharacterized protein n=1 Tax=Trametes coccinea (strain BRFM310) TaxID=1353009 RepID=A0A1Y2J0J7_TRAC3|nr:hypothetical protein PYCCODRAFT_780957 [Trametes coccinea BRFM310]